MDEEKEDLGQTIMDGIKKSKPLSMRTYVYRLTIEQDSMVHKICNRTGLSQNDVIKFILDDVLQTKPNLIFKMIETKIYEIHAEIKERVNPEGKWDDDMFKRKSLEEKIKERQLESKKEFIKRQLELRIQEEILKEEILKED